MGFGAIAAQEAAGSVEVTTDTAFEAEFKVVEEALGEAYGAGGVEEAGFFALGDIAEGSRWAAQEDRGAVNAEDFAEVEEELAEEGFGAE